MPKIELIDMRGSPPNQIIAAQTAATLRAAFDRGEQTVVLFNRQGYAPSIACPGCGATFKCPSCDVNFALHQRSHKLSCHYCGFYRNYSPDCRACGTPFDIVGMEQSVSRKILKFFFLTSVLDEWMQTQPQLEVHITKF